MVKSQNASAFNADFRAVCVHDYLASCAFGPHPALRATFPRPLCHFVTSPPLRGGDRGKGGLVSVIFEFWRNPGKFSQKIRKFLKIALSILPFPPKGGRCHAVTDEGKFYAACLLAKKNFTHTWLPVSADVCAK